MWVKKISIKNYRSLSDISLDFCKGINLIIGQNNSGKSSILKPIMSLQEGLPQLVKEDIRIGQSEANVFFEFEDFEATRFKGYHDINVVCKVDSPQINGTTSDNKKVNIPKFPAKEPGNFIYPYLSGRKSNQMTHQINSENTEKVSGDFSNLNCKIDRLSNPVYPHYQKYINASKAILNFQVTTATSSQGKRAGLSIPLNDDVTQIPLESMGEGVTNVVGFLAHLCLAKNKLFIIEEPENDIHPSALRELLSVITETAKHNQFIITTHSPLVLKCLGSSNDVQLFNVKVNYNDLIPTSNVDKVISPEDRTKALEDLGFHFSDSFLWDGWLFFEESSIERIVNQFFIPWFTPSLIGRLRTVSTATVDKIKIKFDSFNDLFLFTHLIPQYKNKAWVIIDGGVAETAIINTLKDKYLPSGWNDNNFIQLIKHNFEEYYPEPFRTKFDSFNSISNRLQKQEAKKDLLREVIAWISTNTEEAKTKFSESANEIVTHLKNIEIGLGT